MDPFFILSLVYGHLFSKGVDSAMAVSERHIDEEDFSKTLNEFDKRFIEDNDAEITLCGCDMQSVTGERSRLISLAEYYINQDNTNISRNLKQDFIAITCRVIFDKADWEKEKSSKLMKKYLGYFYELVFMKETRKIPIAYRAVINSYADSQLDINRDYDRRITNLETKTSLPQSSGLAPVDFRLYYEEVERRFTAKKRGEYRNLVGEEPDETSYIDAFITKEEEQVPVLPFLEEWFEKTDPGVILIHGEPGHGKTTLCNKAAFEFYKGRFLKEKAENVVAVSLNAFKNPQIVKDGRLNLSNALVFQVGTDDEKTFSFEDCQGSLLFLDGFDEFVDKAKEANVDNICSFMEIVDGIADKYKIHIVILSRTIAVSRDLKDLYGIYEYYSLSPLSDGQQDKWLTQHVEYDGYRETFNKLRNNDDMQMLLEVPFLFRLIVNSRFEAVTSNIVELYDDLFAHLMLKRNIYNEKIEVVSDRLMNLAFEVYCTDTNMAKMDWDPQWVFAFYVESVDGDRIGFFHRTFYQYFLAKYILSHILDIVTDKEAEGFIGLFAERELDATVRCYLSLMINEGNKKAIHNKLKLAIEALVRTEAYLNLEPRYPLGNAEKTKLGRIKNVYRNTMHICAAFSYVIENPFREGLDTLLRIYHRNFITICSTEDNGADLRRANISFSDLRGANLRGANLSGASLKGAYLRDADLKGANLRGADLIDANLSGANLNGADLRGADLRGADLIDANLSGANLNEVNLNESILNIDDLLKNDLISTKLSGAKLRGNHDKEETAVCNRKEIRGINSDLFQWAVASPIYKKAIGNTDSNQEQLFKALGQNEGRRYEGSFTLMQAIWHNHPELGLAPDYTLLTELEYGGKYYTGYRDHTTHMFKVFLLGLYLYEKSERIRNAITAKSFNREDFLSVWILTALFHDIGYVIETEDGCWDSDAGKAVIERLNNHLAYPMSHLFSEVIDKGTEKAIQIDAKLKVDAASRFSIEQKMNDLQDIGPIVKLSNKKNENSVKAYYEYASSKRSGREFYDHGIISASVLLYSCEVVCDYIQRVRNNSVSLYPEQQEKLDAFINYSEKYKRFVKTAAQAIAVHNIQKNWNETEIIELNLKYVTISSFCIPQEHQPIAYLLRVCDELQCWDRQSFSSPLGKTRTSLDPDKLCFIPRPSEVDLSIKEAQKKEEIGRALEGVLDPPLSTILELKD